MYSYEKEIVERDENTVHMNVGPSHPAMHGTLRVKMEVKGERIINTEQEIGFLHTGFEKLGEHRSLHIDQFIAKNRRRHRAPNAAPSNDPELMTQQDSFSNVKSQQSPNGR